MKNAFRKVMIMICVICLGTLAGCGKTPDDSTAKKEVDINVVAEGLLKDVSFKDNLSTIDNEIALSRVYFLEQDKIASGVFYMNTNATAEEIAIVKVNDSAYVENVKAAFENRVSEQKAACKDYLPDEMPKLDSAVIYSSGDYVVLCISNDNDAAKTKIEEYFK